MPLAAAKFQIGDQVHSKPDSMPGLLPIHAAAVTSVDASEFGSTKFKPTTTPDTSHRGFAKNHSN